MKSNSKKKTKKAAALAAALFAFSIAVQSANAKSASSPPEQAGSQSQNALLPEAERKPAAARACSPKIKGAVIIMYHQFNGKHPSTSVTKKMLQDHIKFFRANNFHFLPLKEVVESLKTGRSLPDKAIALTIDDAYKSAYEIAHPILEAEKIPYTIFVNTKAIDSGFSNYMTWSQLKELSKLQQVRLEAHSHAHAYMIQDMNTAQRAADVKTSVERIYQETKQMPMYFAYPYGEASLDFIKELKSYRWKIGGRLFQFQAAFTTQSAPAGCADNSFALPRFALNMKYGRINELFAHKMLSRPFPLQSFSPNDLAYCAKERLQKFSLISHSDLRLKGLQCFASNSGRAKLTIKSPNSADIALSKPFSNRGSHRLNCTQPGQGGRFHWIGKEISILNCK